MFVYPGGSNGWNLKIWRFGSNDFPHFGVRTSGSRKWKQLKKTKCRNYSPTSKILRKSSGIFSWYQPMIFPTFIFVRGVLFFNSIRRLWFLRFPPQKGDINAPGHPVKPSYRPSPGTLHSTAMLSASLCSSWASTTATATWGRRQQGGELEPSPVISRVSTYRGETTPVTHLFSAIYRGTITAFTTIVRGPSSTWQFYIFSSPCKNGGILKGSAAGSSGSFSIKYQQICHMTARRPPCSSCIKSFPSWGQ